MKLIRWLLLPFSLLYFLIVTIRNFLFDLKIIPSSKYQLPLISVGNLNAGGSGKTPHVEYLIRLLKNDYKVAVISRGYGRKTKGMILLHDKHRSNEVGDEPLQMKNKFQDVTFMVSEKRRDAIDFLVNSNMPPEVIILDDAFQHRYVIPGLSILLTDFSNPYYKDFILPVGRLREGARNSRRAQLIVVTKTPEAIERNEEEMNKKLKIRENQHLYFSGLLYKSLMIPDSNEIEIDRKEYIVLVAGIANTNSIEKYLNRFCNHLILLKFADHYQYSDNDLYKINSKFENIRSADKILITTEKDYVRLKELQSFKTLLEKKIYILPVEFYFSKKEKFNEQILKYVRTNQ